MKHLLFSALATIMALLLGTAQGAVAKPNIILIMADDQGWGDTGYNGHPELKTPHLDEMARAGLQLNRFYAGHFNCSPTRGSVMTGRHPNRYGTFSPGAPFRTEELTLAEVLKEAGYATGHFGKWHLNGVRGPGHPIAADDPLSPGKCGFDTWVSVSNYYDLDPMMARNGVAEPFKGDSSDVATDEALRFIATKAAAGQAFLTVLWFGSPHVPHRALDADKAAYRHLPAADQEYFGELTAIDRSVGRVRQTLRELKVSDNTIVWYCSDNGGAAGPRSTGGLRGGKGTLWEGGVRVPGIVEWPSRIKQPMKSEVPCSTLDMFPTLLEAAGIKPAQSVLPMDGTSLLALLDGKMTGRGKAIPFWDQANKKPGHAVLLDWPYKLHLHPAAARGRKKLVNPSQAEVLPEVLLYNVAEDPRETIDLSVQVPERVATMKTALLEWQATVAKSLAGGDYVK